MISDRGRRVRFAYRWVLGTPIADSWTELRRFVLAVVLPDVE